MADSLERFTPEQLEALMQSLREDVNEGGANCIECDRQVRRIFAPLDSYLGASAFYHLKEAQHHVCCAHGAAELLRTGFVYGWKAREALMDQEELEKLAGGGK